VDNNVDNSSWRVQQVGLDEVTAEDVTELLGSHGQQLCNGDLQEQAKEIRQQKGKKKDRDEEAPIKCMKKKVICSVSFQPWIPS
jgi:hypothetical protein